MLTLFLPGVDGKDDGQPRVLASFMTALMKGDPLVLVNGGEVKKIYIYIYIYYRIDSIRISG